MQFDTSMYLINTTSLISNGLCIKPKYHYRGRMYIIRNIGATAPLSECDSRERTPTLRWEKKEKLDYITLLWHYRQYPQNLLRQLIYVRFQQTIQETSGL